MSNTTTAKLGSNATPLDAPPDGLSHNELLMRLNRLDAPATMLADQESNKEFDALRALMVEKYGEGRVVEVEREIKGEG
jgi:hypothetical protein